MHGNGISGLFFVLSDKMIVPVPAVKGYKAIEKGAVGGYKKIEDGNVFYSVKCDIIRSNT